MKTLRTLCTRTVIVGALLAMVTAVLLAQQPVNNATVVGTVIDVGAGNSSAGTQRVVIASNQVSIPTTQGLSTSGGYAIYHVVSAATTNTANIKASAGQVYLVRVYNNVGYPIYVKLYNTAGTPTAGTSVIETFAVQAGTGLVVPIVSGRPFAAGIGISITKGITDADATATALSDCVVDVYYN